MSDLVSIFSSGMSHLVDFSIVSSVSFVGICLAIRGVEYAKTFVTFADSDTLQVRSSVDSYIDDLLSESYDSDDYEQPH